MQAEVDAENAAKAAQKEQEEAEGEGSEGESEGQSEGTLTDPNTGEVVKMPTEEEVEAEEDSGILGGYESPLLGDGSGAPSGEE